MENLEKLMELASIFGKVPQIHVYNSSRGYYRGINEGYKSALRPAPLPQEDEPTRGALSKSSVNQEFEYSPLSREIGQMRLVTLLPRSQTGTEIYCSLDHVSLDDYPKYCALSYAWGNPAATHSITLNGRQAFITENLDGALRNLQHENECLVMWIDSLCINQRDDTEKMHQVQQMASIYSSAAIVLAWLGPGSVESDFAIYKLDDLNCRHHEMLLRISASKEPVEELIYSELGRLVESLTIGSESECDVPITAISELLRKGYWNRVWIQQEIALAKDIIFVCGKTDIDKRHLSPALQTCMMCSAFRSRGSLAAGAGHWDLLGLGAYIPEIIVENYASKKEQPLTSFLTRLKFGRGHRLVASNERDYVYGFLGLAIPESTFDIVPDYNKSVAQLYVELSREALRSGDVDVLRCAGGDRTSSTIDNLPSWVVDWSLQQRSSMSISIDPQGGTRCFSASGSQKSSCQSLSEGVLTISGVQVDTIRAIGPTWEYQPKLNESARHKYISFIQELEALYESGENENYEFESTWRVPITDMEGLSSTSFSSETGLKVVRRATKAYSLAGFSSLVGYAAPLETLPTEERDKTYSYIDP